MRDFHSTVSLEFSDDCQRVAGRSWAAREHAIFAKVVTLTTVAPARLFLGSTWRLISVKSR